MIIIKNFKNEEQRIVDFQITSPTDYTLNAEGRLLLPGLIDSHISLGSPDRENWAFGVKSAIRGGFTTVLDLPSLNSPSENKLELEQKRKSVDKFLSELKIPLHYFMYNKGNSDYIEEMGLEKSLLIGSSIFLTHEDHLLGDRQWDRLFQMAAWEDLPLIINSRNENSWSNARFKQPDETLLEKAIYYAEKQNTRLYVLNVATLNEIELIKRARAKSLLIYAETTPQHLFPQIDSQASFLWEALNVGVIESIGSGYQVESESQERIVWEGGNFDFLNPIFLLPLLLTAHLEGKITLEKVVRLTRVNLFDIFNIERKKEDVVLIDLEEEQVIERINKNVSRKIKLRGWPKYTIVNGQIFACPKGGYQLTPIV